MLVLFARFVICILDVVDALAVMFSGPSLAWVGGGRGRSRNVLIEGERVGV